MVVLRFNATMYAHADEALCHPQVDHFQPYSLPLVDNLFLLSFDLFLDAFW